MTYNGGGDAFVAKVSDFTPPATLTLTPAADTNPVGTQQRYEDHGPVQPLTVESINVRAIVCVGTTQADIFGEATSDGSGSFSYRISVKDLGEPGKGMDTYSILLQTSYSSGEQTLEGGNVQIRRTQ